MTVFTTDMQSQVAQLSACRIAQESELNADRLASWQRRYWHTPVSVPAPVNPPEWPARRISLEMPSKVRRLRVSIA